jgi:hypothetical protein
MRFLGPIPVRLDFFCCMDIRCGFPGVVCIWISFPFDEKLELLAAPEVAVLGDSFYFVFFCSFYKVWRWPCVVGPMRSCLVIRAE